MTSCLVRIIEKEVRQKHEKEKAKQMEYADTRKKATEKTVKPKDKVLIQQKRTNSKDTLGPCSI